MKFDYYQIIKSWYFFILLCTTAFVFSLILTTSGQAETVRESINEEISASDSDLITATPFMFKDLSPGTADTSIVAGSVINDKYVFIADHDLWWSDGTQANTGVLKTGDTRLILPEFNGELYLWKQCFRADWYCLWKTDGTAEGTVQVADFPRDDYEFSSVKKSSSAIVLDNHILFIAYERQTKNYKLWKSDGTDAGTIALKTIAGGDGLVSGWGDKMTALNGTAYFRIMTASNYQLWKSDGTETGTELLKSFQKFLNIFLYFNNTLYLTADDGNGDGHELWTSDGTVGGTELFNRLLNPGSSNSLPWFHGELGGSLIFSATNNAIGRELWISDGTASGTQVLRNINPGSESAEIRGGEKVGDIIYLEVENGPGGVELWKTDGTSLGTEAVKVFGSGGTIGEDFNLLLGTNGILLFCIDDGINGRELWQSDGTQDGTRIIADINPGSENSSPSNMAAYHHTLFFAAVEDIHGRELWAIILQHDVFIPTIQR